jgi:hypothetical protein
MVFIAVAVHMFSRWYPDKRIAAILIAALLSYAAWGFKQNFLYIPGTIGLFLLIRRDWIGAVTFTFLLVGAAVLSLWLGGPNYVESLLVRGTNTELSWSVFMHNFSNFAVKFLPVLITFLACLGLIATSPAALRAVIIPIRARPVLLLPFLGVIVSLFGAMPTSAIINSAENHYFAPAIFLTLSTLQMVVHLYRGYGRIKLIVVAGTVGCLLNFVAVSAVLGGLQGIVSVRPFHEGLMMQKNCLSSVVEPTYVFNSYLALPWVIPSRHPFVVHFDYWRDIADGVEKESGGIHGLVKNGYFATIVLPQERTGSPFANLDLTRYQARPLACQEMTILERKGAPGSGRQP